MEMRYCGAPVWMTIFRLPELLGVGTYNSNVMWRSADQQFGGEPVAGRAENSGGLWAM